ncbi:tryptophan aminotransferase-related protein 3-like protein [Tanacetum coccineum]
MAPTANLNQIFSTFPVISKLSGDPKPRPDVPAARLQGNKMDESQDNLIKPTRRVALGLGTIGLFANSNVAVSLADDNGFWLNGLIPIPRASNTRRCSKATGLPQTELLYKDTTVILQEVMTRMARGKRRTRSGSGDPIFMEEFWMQNAENSAVVISGWHRMSYWYNDDTMMSTELEKYIRQLHSLVGNANTEGRYIVFGLGAIQLLSAAVYALSSQKSSSPPTVVASAPFYQLFKFQSMLFNSNFEDANSWKSNNSSDDADVIEFVTSPSNPGGELKTSVVGGNSVYDHVYFWPHFTPIPSPSDHDIMIFSLSKLTGHAGTRFGWAVIKDKDVYDKVSTYIKVADLGISKDSQLRALKLIKVVVEDDGRSEILYTATSLTKSPAYAWIKCERDEDVDCAAILEAGNILGTSGSTFSDDDRYVRLNLMKSNDDFNLLMQRLNELVAQENNASKIGVAQKTLQNAVHRGSKAMTELEARQILGVTGKSSWEEIAQASTCNAENFLYKICYNLTEAYPGQTGPHQFDLLRA